MKKEVGKRRSPAESAPSWRGQRKGISPVVATVLLVAIVIIIALIIFLWFRNIGGETCTKFQGQNVQLVCGNVEFFASYDSATGELTISNTGNVPIFSVNVRVNTGGDYETIEIVDTSYPGLSNNWPSFGLNQGDVYTSGNMDYKFGSADSLVITPILMSSCGGTEKAYECDDNQHGYEVDIF